jgi:hypothetical protein
MTAWRIAFCLVASLIGATAFAEVQRDVNQDIDAILAGRAPPLHIANASHRIAVFEFQDPDSTGLGSAVAALIAREVLLRSGLRSLGVLRYYGSLEPTKSHRQSYFDKVDLVVDAQQASLAIWGMIRRDGDAILIDVQAQLPDAMVDEYYSWSLTLPRAMGGGRLGARLTPTRMQIQRVRLPVQSVPTLRSMAEAIDTLRAAPRADAQAIGRLPRASTYSVAEIRGDWAKFETDGKTGWVRRATQCTRECAPLLATAEFIGALLKFAEGGPVPQISRAHSRDAAVVARQLVVLTNLRRKVFHPARYYLEKWDYAKAADYGAPYAGVLALTEIASALQAFPTQAYDEIRLDETVLREITKTLAEASQNDPRNVEVLDNLAVLFAVLGDERRAGLAAELAADVKGAKREGSDQ